MTDEPLVRVTDLHVYFPVSGGTVRAVDGVDLDVPAGKTVALVGESGCGKSTLARAIMGLVPVHSGRVEYRGEPVAALGTAQRRTLCRQMQMVFQDPAASLNPRMTLASAIAEPLRLHGLATAGDVDARVCSLLEKVGFDPALRNRYPHELSGGQRQRICIARALAVSPELVVCDEAVSALDVSIQAQIINLLAQLQRDDGLTYLFITHDLAVVRHLADHVAVMYLGRIVESRPCDALFDSPEHPYTQMLLSAVPSLSGDTKPASIVGELPSPLAPPPGCTFHPRCPHAAERCRRQAPVLHPLRNGGESRCHLADPSKPLVAPRP